MPPTSFHQHVKTGLTEPIFFWISPPTEKTVIFNRTSVNNNIKIYRGIYATRKLLPSRKLYKPGQRIRATPFCHA